MSSRSANPCAAAYRTVGPGRGRTRMAELRYELQVLVRWIYVDVYAAGLLGRETSSFLASPLFLARVLALQLLLHILHTRGKKKKKGSLHQSMSCWYMLSCMLFISVQTGLSLAPCLASSSNIVK